MGGAFSSNGRGQSSSGEGNASLNFSGRKKVDFRSSVGYRILPGFFEKETSAREKRAETQEKRSKDP
jgi:hypothetical protein